MNIGIVIHSQTGNTEFVAHKISEQLKSKGQKSDYIKLKVVGSQKRTNDDIKFESMPDLSSYDMLFFGSHVEGFNLAQAMKKYLSDVESLEGKKIICILTQGLPYKWMGANQALKQMKALLKAKGADVISATSVSWSNKEKRQEKINTLVGKAVGLI